jgi:hypothetical protein
MHVTPTGSPLFAFLFVTAAVIMAIWPAGANEAPVPNDAPVQYRIVATLNAGPHEAEALVGPLVYHKGDPAYVFTGLDKCKAFMQTNEDFKNDILQLLHIVIGPALAQHPGAVLDVSCIPMGQEI